MLKQIHISELKPGMHIADPGIDWTKRPYLYAADEHVESDAQIARIREQGYQEVYIDLARSEAKVFTDTLPSGEELPARPPVQQRPASPLASGPKVAIEEELPKAVKVHDQSVAYARQFMNDMRSGKVNLTEASGTMENIMGSLERNADALISLSRLHQTDSYTYSHCVNVCVLTTLFSRHLGEDHSTVFTAGMAGLFHDLGKSLVPLEILNAPRRLSEEEFAVMRSHPTLGYEQLAAVPDINPTVLHGALQHHEKHSGGGYPNGIAGDEISGIGRMVGVSDIYDALTSRRPYKGAMFPHKALGIMYEMRGKELHPDYISQFIRMLGVYPVGSVVELEDGSRGLVTASNVDNPAKPAVTLLRDPFGNPVRRPKVVDMSTTHLPAIARCLPAEGSGIDPALVLGLPANTK